MEMDSSLLSIKILENEESENGIQFPVPEDGRITLKDIQDAFPGTTGFRYRDEGTSTPNHILCRDGTFLEPLHGWCKKDRVYFVLKSDSNQNRRVSHFERYRQEIEKHRTTSSSQRRQRPQNSESSDLVKLHIGRGHFRNGIFKKLTACSAVGGIVLVGPFPKDTNCVQQIKEDAFRKFQNLLREFRRRFDSCDQMTLVYPDGSVVNNLPDGSAKFTIRGYRDYIDPTKKYERLRLYLVETVEIENEIEIRSEDSSDSLPDPFEEENKTLAEMLKDQHENQDCVMQTVNSHVQNENAFLEDSALHTSSITEQIDLTEDDTLPIEIKVRFTFSGNAVLTGRFEQSAKVERLAIYVHDSGMYRENKIQFTYRGEIMDHSSELYRFSPEPNQIMEIEIKPITGTTDRVFGRLSLRRPVRQQIPEVDNMPTSSSPTPDEGTDKELEMEEMIQIVNNHAIKILKPTPDEDPQHFNNLNISRYYALEDLEEYLNDPSYDYLKKIKVHFISNFGDHEDLEIALDEGGPRREFFRLVQDALIQTSGLFEGPDTMKIFSTKVSAVKKERYLFAGYTVAAALLMGGQPFCCLTPSLVDYIVYGKSTHCKPLPSEIPDYELRSALQEIIECTTTEEMRQILDSKMDIRFQLGVDSPTCNLAISNKQELVDDVCLSYIIHRSTPAIQQFKAGIEMLQVHSLLRKYPSLKCFLQYSERFEVNASKMKKIMKPDFSPIGSNRRRHEERLAKRLLDYVDEIERSPRNMDDHEITLQSLLSFSTGLSRLPPTGLEVIYITFDHEVQDGALPSANTCGCVLNLPVYDDMANKNIFYDKMDKAILYAGGMHAL